MAPDAMAPNSTADDPPEPPVAVDVNPLDPAWDEWVTDAAARAAHAARAAVEAVPADQRPAPPVSVSVVLADDAAVHALNRDYRGAAKPTNVLAFAALEADGMTAPGDPEPLGDVVLARETVTREAGEQGKPVRDHMTHLVVHGTLHLLGHDHMTGGEAAAMEALETRVLADLGIGDPYGDEM